MTRTIGIDPGINGALVLLEDGRPIEWLCMPTVKEGKTTRVNAPVVARWLAQSARTEDGRVDAHVYVEATAARPGQGVSSMYNFGHSNGVVIGVLGGLGIAYTLVQPAGWKKRAGLIGTEKDAARSRAIQLWPTWAALEKKGAGQALADAALIARFG